MKLHYGMRWMLPVPANFQEWVKAINEYGMEVQGPPWPPLVIRIMFDL